MTLLLLHFRNLIRQPGHFLQTQGLRPPFRIDVRLQQTGLHRRADDGEAGAYTLIGKQTEGNPTVCFFIAWDTVVLP